MISLRPSLITEHHSVSSLNDLAREASPCSRYLRPARDEDTTYTVGGDCSRVDGDKRTDHIEPRSYSLDASVDQTDARGSSLSMLPRRASTGHSRRALSGTCATGVPVTGTAETSRRTSAGRSWIALESPRLG